MKINSNTFNLTIAILGVLGVAATIHSMSSDTLRLNYAIAAITIVSIALLLVAIQQFTMIQSFPNRASLGQSLDSELGAAQEAWVSMHSGSIKGVDGDLLKTPRRLKVVLPNPDHDALKHIAKISQSNLQKLQSGIVEVSARLKSAGAEVYWFDGYIGNAITIANPETTDAWARVEAIIPYASPSERPSLKVTASQSPEFFKTLNLHHFFLTQ